MNEQEAKELVKKLYESRRRNEDIVDILETLVSTLVVENQMFRELQHKILKDVNNKR